MTLKCPPLPPTPQPINGNSLMRPNEAADYLLSIDDKIRSHMRKKLVTKGLVPVGTNAMFKKRTIKEGRRNSS